MEMSDEYQDMVNPGGGMGNLQTMGSHHRQTPESSLPPNVEPENGSVDETLVKLPQLLLKNRIQRCMNSYYALHFKQLSLLMKNESQVYFQTCEKDRIAQDFIGFSKRGQRTHV
ncbi:hypothetical protein M0802_007579 [Mischocyttarus mexicanus]|nr:hypothetical protein M0802_007579 [Mischocyttarus mexicanus]